MVYCSIRDVKGVLQSIDEDDVTFDSEISGCIVTGSGVVDALLRKEGLTVPSPTPQGVVDAAKCFAAWDFRHRRDPVGAESFWEQAQRFLSVYVDGVKEPYVGSV